jgi:hypothetical protein
MLPFGNVFLEKIGLFIELTRNNLEKSRNNLVQTQIEGEILIIYDRITQTEGCYPLLIGGKQGKILEKPSSLREIFNYY